MSSVRPILDEATVATEVQQFEQLRNAFALRDGGISLWRLVRFEVSLALQNFNLQRATLSRKRLLGTIPGAAWQFLTARPVQIIGKTYNSSLRDKRGVFFRDVYFDDLFDQVPNSGLLSSLDSAGFDEAMRRAHRKPVFDDTSIIVVSAALGRLFGRKPSPQARQLAGFISSDLGLHDYTPELLQRKVDVFRYRKMLYRAMLRRFGVKLVLSANTGQHALIAAARSVGIPYVEVQHGDFGQFNPEAVPDYALTGDDDALMLPDRLAVYGQRDVDGLASTAMGKLSRLCAVGAPAVAVGRIAREQRFKSAPNCPIIIFTSQGFARERVEGFLRSVLAIYQGKFRLLIKLHPGYDSDSDGEKYRAIAMIDPRLEVLSSQADVPTYELIALADLHMSISSACHYDAIGVGTPTAVMPIAGCSAMKHLVDAGCAIQLESAEHLARLIETRSWPHITEQQSAFVFKPGYIDNMIELMRELKVLTQ